MIPVRLLLILLLAMPWLSLRATPSDSINVLSYEIHLDTIVNAAQKRIYAHTRLRILPKVSNLSTISLDLLKLTIDSIQVQGIAVAYTYNDTLIAIQTPQPYSLTDTVFVEVWYQGQPRKDASFGGFYFQGNYVFNIGVALQADPHNFGRAWFPCKDNFKDRATFDFYIRHDTSLTAVCNGTLQSLIPHGDGSQTAHWRLRDPIPTYLAGMVVAPYVRVDDYFISISGDTIPLQIYAVPADTNNAKSQSANLKAGIAVFENLFGAYSWERVGYVMVTLPLSGSIGAMEHATNIVFPRIILALGQQYETIWAHEISHAWFGNLVTCEDAAEMWLNEGWATYCENIFTEAIYGGPAYKSAVRDMHSDVLRRAHQEDGGYQALSSMPTNHTYSRTTYVKGAGIAHTLRHQLGDSAFFAGLRNYLSAHAWADVNSDSLRLSLEASSGLNLQDFFDLWVAQAGFPHFAIDSFSSSFNGSNYDITIHIRQRKKETVTFAQNTLATLRLTDSNLMTEDHRIVLAGAVQTVTFTANIDPRVVSFDPEEGLTDATTDNYQRIDSLANYVFPQTWCQLKILAQQGSDWLRVVHNWLAPDSFQVPRANVNLSDSRYWTLEGLFLPGLDVEMKLSYNGSLNSNTGLMDHTWLNNSEDSILVFYRPNPATDWAILSNVNLITGNINDKVGSVLVSNAQPGDYALGIYDTPLGFSAGQSDLRFGLHPNPTEGVFELDLPPALEKLKIAVLDLEGKVVFTTEPDVGSETARIDLSGLAEGIYLVMVRDHSGRSGLQKIVIAK